MGARPRRLTRVLGSLLLLAMLAAGPPASAQPTADVAGAVAKWTVFFAEDSPDSVLALYDDDAVLWGTLSPTLLAGKPAVRGYFERAFKALPGHRVTFGEQRIRIYGDIAINSGYYTFTHVKDGQVQTIPARYSFVYRKRGNDWLIVDHHSSATPAPPK